MSEIQEHLYRLPLDHFRSYLKTENWMLVNDNSRWLVFENNDSVEIAIPKNTRAPDFFVYVDSAVKKLATVQDKEPNVIADEILTFDLDAFGVILDKAADATSVSIRRATVVLSELKQLIVYSASAELSANAKPFHKYIPAKARMMLNNYRFAHTVRNSFGCRIESKTSTGPHIQMKMFGEQPETIRPPARKVLERIVTGLVSTDEAATTGNICGLTEGYGSGLNANMCTAIINMSEEVGDDLEYWVKWSKKLPALDELQDISNFSVGSRHREKLEIASENLYSQDPEFTSIVGYVTNLSQMNPEPDDLGAGIIAIQRITPEGRSQKVHLVVDEEAHSKAVDAYRDKATVGVNGYLEYRSQKWHLRDPERLRIVT